MTETKAFYDEMDENEALEGDQETDITQEIKTRPEFRSGSLLTLDVGSVHTRAGLFDIVEGRARFLAAGRSPTTAGAPMFDASEGIRYALDRVEEISGRVLIAQDGQPMIPSTEQGYGVDYVASTLSSGPPLKTVVVGLLDQVSLASITNLAKTSYTEIVASIGLNNAQSAEKLIDTIQRTQPDMILISGGTEKGASLSVLRLVNLIGMALYLLPEESRPEVLFAGNTALAKQVHAFLTPMTNVHLAPNIRPALALEHLGPAQSILNDTLRGIHVNRVSGLSELNQWSSNNLMPTAHGLGRVTRFFSKIVPGTEKSGVLGVDVGASSTVVAGSFDGDLRLRVHSNLGMGEGLAGVLSGSQLDDVTRWIPGEVSPSYVLDYIQNKILNPGILPVTPEDLYLEQALAREILSRAVEQSLPAFPKMTSLSSPPLMVSFPPLPQISS